MVSDIARVIISGLPATMLIRQPSYNGSTLPLPCARCASCTGKRTLRGPQIVPDAVPSGQQQFRTSASQRATEFTAATESLVASDSVASEPSVAKMPLRARRRLKGSQGNVVGKKPARTARASYREDPIARGADFASPNGGRASVSRRSVAARPPARRSVRAAFRVRPRFERSSPGAVWRAP